jgi:hypothetical protein
MTESTTLAWILYSISDGGSTLRAIIGMADAINHSIPTHKELQTSLGWLQARGLVIKEGELFARTKAGSQLFSRCKGSNVHEAWDMVSEQLETMIGVPAAPEKITIEETTSAYNAYREEMWRKFKT